MRSFSKSTFDDDPKPRQSQKCIIPLLPRSSRISLPQYLSPDEIDVRAQELAHNRTIYIYESPPTIPNISFIKGPYYNLPGQSPSLSFRVRVALVGLKILANKYRVSNKPLRILSRALPLLFAAAAADEKHPERLDNAMTAFTYHSKHPGNSIDTISREFAEARAASSNFEERSPLLEPYRSLYRFLAPPKVAHVFLEDAIFARMRIAGYNPMSLFRVRFLKHSPFVVDDSHMPTPGDTIAAAVTDGRLFALDFTELDSVDPDDNKYLVPSAALFALPPSSTPHHKQDDLHPIAIKLPDQIVYPPPLGSPAALTARWDVAKHIVNTCDAVHHELVAHLGRTHLLVEPFIAATMRQLPPTHPLHVLLLPHFEGTVFINELASQSLVAPGGDVDRIFAGDISSIMTWCADRVVSNQFNQCFPTVDLDKRGLLYSRLKFPYCEDALAHFDAMLEWVNGYLKYYYKSDDDVMEDEELTAWVHELTDDDLGRVKDFGDDGDGEIRTVEYLARAVTFVIFSSSVQHAAVNFPQLDLMSYAPALSGGLWGPPPRPDEECTVLTWAGLLPPTDTAVEQIDILGVIGAVYYTKLGEYGKGHFRDSGACGAWPKAVREAHNAYRRRLREIDRRIVSRERGNVLKYEYLRPGKIPQSINI